MSASKFKTPEDKFYALCGRTNNGCWTWTGPVFSTGYARMNRRPVNEGAHLFSYRLHNGPVPDGMQVCHSCDNPLCVNPEHLFLGSAKENSDDKFSKGRQAKLSGAMTKKKLSTQDAEQIILRNKTGEPLSKLASEYGISRRYAHMIKSGRYHKKASGRNMVEPW